MPPYHHSHHRPPADFGLPRRFAIGVALNLGFVVIEAAGGIASGSLALLADAGHNLSDVLALMIAWGATLLSRRKPTPQFTYGLGGTSIWAALANSIILMVACGGIAWEAVRRLQQPSEISGLTVVVIASLGVIINSATAMLFLRDRHRDLNVRGAFLHMVGDAAISLGVVVTGLLLINGAPAWLDPMVSMAIVAVIVASTLHLFRDSMRLALHAVPAGIDPAAVKDALQRAPGVAEVHDLHIWAMSTTETALTAHLVVPGSPLGDEFHEAINQTLEHQFGIQHATIQVERGTLSRRCKLAPDEVV